MGLKPPASSSDRPNGLRKENLGSQIVKGLDILGRGHPISLFKGFVEGDLVVESRFVNKVGYRIGMFRFALDLGHTFGNSVIIDKLVEVLVEFLIDDLGQTIT